MPRTSAIRKSVASPAPGVPGTATGEVSGAPGVGCGVGLEHPTATLERASTDMRTVRAGAVIAGDVSDGAPRWSIVELVFATIVAAGCGRSESTPSSDGTPATASTETSAPLSRRLEPAIAELLVSDLTPPTLRDAATDARVDAILQRAFFDPARTFARAPAAAPTGCHARVSLGYAILENGKPVATAEAGVARAVVEAELDCPDPTDPTFPAKLEGFRVAVSDERPFGGTHGGTGPERRAEAIAQVASDGAARLFGQVTTRHVADDQILANLADAAHRDHPGILAESAIEAGERHLAAAIPALVRLTAHANLQVATRAGAALGLLKANTPEALQALVRMTEGPTTERHRVAIMALGDLGTPEARRYLDTLAVGHPSLDLRELARERLRALATPTE